MNRFQAVVSTYHLLMKFSVGNQIGYASGDQVLSRKYYMLSVKAGEAKKRVAPYPENHRTQVDLKKKNINSDPLEKDRSRQMHPVEELLSMELFPHKWALQQG